MSETTPSVQPATSIRLDSNVEIDRPVEVVFEYVTAVENNAEWEPRVVQSPPAEDEMGEGTTWTAVAEGFVGTTEITMECIEYDPPASFGYHTPEGMLGGRVRTAEATYRFVSTDGGTRVEWSATMEVNGLFRLLRPLVARMFGSDVDTSLSNLKGVLESDGA